MIKIGAAGALLLVAFLALGHQVSHATPAIDLVIANATSGLWQGTSGAVVAVVSAVLGPVLPIVVGVALAAGAVAALVRHDRFLAGLLFRAIVLLALCRLVSLFKTVFARARPRAYPDWAYPSGHVVSVSSVGVTAIALCAWLASRLLPWVIGVSVLLIILSATCRVLLDVHWLTDVVGAVLGVAGVGLLGALALRLLPVRTVEARTGPLRVSEGHAHIGNEA